MGNKRTPACFGDNVGVDFLLSHLVDSVTITAVDDHSYYNKQQIIPKPIDNMKAHLFKVAIVGYCQRFSQDPLDDTDNWYDIVS